MESTDYKRDHDYDHGGIKNVTNSEIGAKMVGGPILLAPTEG